MNDHAFRKLIATGIIALIGTLLVGAGEFLLHYSSGGYEGAAEFKFFEYVSPNRLFIGHFLATLTVPLYFVGYYHLYLVLKPGSKVLALVVMGMGVYAFAIADVWIGSRALLGFMVNKRLNADLEAVNLIGETIAVYNTYLESLLGILRVLVLLISIVYVYLVVKGKTLYPQWMAAMNPVLLLISVFLIFFTIPAIGNYIAPIAMNVAHFVFFSLSLYTLFSQRSKRLI